MHYTLITGASSGIGYELADLFGKKGNNLILISRDKSRLRLIATDLQNKYKINVKYFPVDLSDINSAQYLYNIIKEKNLTVKYLINNAGFYAHGPFLETAWKEELDLINLQCITHTRLTKLFLPEMIELDKAGILNIGSTGSFVPGPYNTVYCAAKSFVLSFSEALAEELSNTNINVTALCPGGTRTHFQDYSNLKRSFLSPIMEASEVAKIGYKALMQGKRVVIPGFMNRIQVMATRIIPRNLVTKLTGKMVMI